MLSLSTAHLSNIEYTCLSLANKELNFGQCSTQDYQHSVICQKKSIPVRVSGTRQFYNRSMDKSHEEDSRSRDDSRSQPSSEIPANSSPVCYDADDGSPASGADCSSSSSQITYQVSAPLERQAVMTNQTASSSTSASKSIHSLQESIKRKTQRCRPYWKPCIAFAKPLFLVLQFVVMCWELHEMRSELRTHRLQLQNRSTNAEVQEVSITKAITYAAVILGTICTFCLINFYLNFHVFEDFKRLWSSLRRLKRLYEKTILPLARRTEPNIGDDTSAASNLGIEAMGSGPSSFNVTSRLDGRRLPDLAKASRAITMAHSDTMRQRASKTARSRNHWTCESCGFLNSRMFDAGCAQCARYPSF